MKMNNSARNDELAREREFVGEMHDCVRCGEQFDSYHIDPMPEDYTPTEDGPTGLCPGCGEPVYRTDIDDNDQDNAV